MSVAKSARARARGACLKRRRGNSVPRLTGQVFRADRAKGPDLRQSRPLARMLDRKQFFEISGN